MKNKQKELREGSGKTEGARCGMAVQRSIAACVRLVHRDVQPTARRSVRYGRVLGMATKLPRQALGVHQAAEGCIGYMRLCQPCDHYVEPARARVTA